MVQLNQCLSIFSVLLFIVITIGPTSLLAAHFDALEGDQLVDDVDDDDDDKRIFVNKTLRTNRFSTPLRFTNRESSSSEPYIRLSSSLFKPIRYNIYWDLTEGIETFSGTVNISFMVLQSTRSLAIQINTLNITSLSLYYQESGEPIIVTKSWLSKSDIYIIETSSNVTDHRMISMYVKFAGTFQSIGFIIHTATAPITRWTYMTKFEPIHARKAFPCFDEPDMKAHFTISVRHNSSLSAYSNMPLEGIIRDDSLHPNWQISTFQESPLMTTYLVALVVCDCQRSISSTSRGVEVGIITLKEDEAKTDYALSIAVKSMEYFQQYLQIDYKFPKLDIFAAPHYPSVGMEHSGLIIQFYHRILYQKDGDYEVYNKEWVLYTTAHEIAHQWFGNLVTLKWWEHTWLNEGFATYFATKAVDYVDPGMSADDLFLIHRYRNSLAYDLRGIYNPWNRTVTPITNANQIKQSFSWLVYQKGGSILRMMEEFMGHDNMTKLIRSYLTKFADSNVITRDFSEEAEKYYPEINMTEFIDSWTQQSGSPIITVTYNENGNVRLSQISSLTLKSYKESSSFPKNPDSHENFINSTDSVAMGKNSLHIVSPSSSSSTSSSSNRLVNESSVIWLIPVTYKTSDGSSGLIWLNKSSEEYRLCDNCSWIVFNVNKKGYFIVNYSRDQWLTIIDALNSEPESFPPQTFTGLLHDVHHLFDLGLIQVDLFFNLISNVKRYTSLAPLSIALTWSKVALAAPSFGEGRYLLYQYRRDLLESIYEKVSMIPSPPTSQEPYAKMILRNDLLEDACEMKVPDCLRDASQYLSSWIENGTYIPSYLQNVVFRYGMATLNNLTHWEMIMNNVLTGNLNGIKGTSLIRGLFAIKDDNLREKAYSLLKDTEYEIEASVLIESKCPSISAKPNPLKSVVLKWLINTNSYGYPWRYEKSSIPSSLVQHSAHPLSESEINLLNQQSDPVNPFSYSINLLLLSPSTLMQLKGSLDLNYQLNGTTKYCSLNIGPQLTITTISVYSIGNMDNNHYQQSKQLIANSFHYRRNNLFIIEFQSILQPGHYLIHCTYSGNYSPAVIMSDQHPPNGQSNSLRVTEKAKRVQLKGGFNLFPTFNHSTNTRPSFNINLVYRLVADEPLVARASSSSSGSIDGPTVIHSASTAFVDILPSQMRIYLSPEKVRLTGFDNETELFLTFDNTL